MLELFSFVVSMNPLNQTHDTKLSPLTIQVTHEFVVYGFKMRLPGSLKIKDGGDLKLN
jgi:hypothetical protein